jgi:hypothetical protein
VCGLVPRGTSPIGGVKRGRVRPGPAEFRPRRSIGLRPGHQGT